MTWSQLRTFLAVARTGSVHGAAQRLVVTDSAVSAALAALRRQVDVDLVRREGRGLALTPAGEVYADYAARVLGLLEEGRLAARDAADPDRGTVRVAAVTTAAEQLLPAVLAGFRERHPGIGVQLAAGNRAQTREQLLGYGADVMVSGRPPADLGLTVRATRRNELIVVAAAEHAGTPAHRLPWLLREEGSGTRATTEALLAELEIPPGTLTVGSNAAIRECVIAGLGVTLLSKDAVADDVAAGRLVQLPVAGTPLRRDWYVVTHSGTVGPSATLLVSHMLDTGLFTEPANPEGGSRPDWPTATVG